MFTFISLFIGQLKYVATNENSKRYGRENKNLASLMWKLIFFFSPRNKKSKNINRKKVIKENNDSDCASEIFYLIWMIKSKTGEFLESCK